VGLMMERGPIAESIKSVGLSHGLKDPLLIIDHLQRSPRTGTRRGNHPFVLRCFPDCRAFCYALKSSRLVKGPGVATIANCMCNKVPLYTPQCYLLLSPLRAS
jgi:hypothetical protein